MWTIGHCFSDFWFRTSEYHRKIKSGAVVVGGPRVWDPWFRISEYHRKMKMTELICAVVVGGPHIWDPWFRISERHRKIKTDSAYLCGPRVWGPWLSAYLCGRSCIFCLLRYLPGGMKWSETSLLIDSLKFYLSTWHAFIWDWEELQREAGGDTCRLQREDEMRRLLRDLFGMDWLMRCSPEVSQCNFITIKAVWTIMSTIFYYIRPFFT